MATLHAMSTPPGPPFARGGKGYAVLGGESAQRNRDQRGTSARPTFHHPGLALPKPRPSGGIAIRHRIHGNIIHRSHPKERVDGHACGSSSRHPRTGINVTPRSCWFPFGTMDRLRSHAARWTLQAVVFQHRSIYDIRLLNIPLGRTDTGCGSLSNDFVLTRSGDSAHEGPSMALVAMSWRGFGGTNRPGGWVCDGVCPRRR